MENNEIQNGYSLFKEANIAIFGMDCVGISVAELLIQNFIYNISIFYTPKSFPEKNNCIHLNKSIYSNDLTKTTIEQYLIELNPGVNLIFHSKDLVSIPDLSSFSYVIDTQNSIEDKINLIKYCKAHHIPVISCMDMSGRINPAAIHFGNAMKVKDCEMAKIISQKLKKCEIENLDIVYSSERPKSPDQNLVYTECINCRRIPSIAKTCMNRRVSTTCNAYVTSMAGMKLASKVVSNVIQKI